VIHVSAEALPLSFEPANAVSPTALSDAFNASFADYLIAFPTLDADGWRAFVQRQGVDLSASSIACRGETVVAFALVTPRPAKRTRIAVMGARPEERGSGAAAQLLDRAIAASDARGDHWIELEAFAQNERAVRLYRSRGFEAAADLRGYVAPPGQGMARAAEAREVSPAEASQWAAAFDAERPAWIPWQVGGEAIAASVEPPEAWRVGDAQLVFRKSDATTIVVSSLLERNEAQSDAISLLALLRHRYPHHLLRAPQLQRGDGSARAFEAARWRREPLHQLLMRRTFRPTPAASRGRG
jgi:ribosomal protein S18 acetylase RimI-like enzyme